MAIGTFARRLFLSVPFGIAAVLNVFMIVAPLLRIQRLEAYVFLFFAPWAWLLDQGWLPEIGSRWFEVVAVYIVLLWIPAALYSGILWLVLRAFSFSAGRAKRSDSSVG